MNNPLIFTDPSGYRPVLIFEAEEHYLRQNPGVDFDYFAWGSKWGKPSGVSYGWSYNIHGANNWEYDWSTGNYVNKYTGERKQANNESTKSVLNDAGFEVNDNIEEGATASYYLFLGFGSYQDNKTALRPDILGNYEVWLPLFTATYGGYFTQMITSNGVDQTGGSRDNLSLFRYGMRTEFESLPINTFIGRFKLTNQITQSKGNGPIKITQTNTGSKIFTLGYSFTGQVNISPQKLSLSYSFAGFNTGVSLNNGVTFTTGYFVPTSFDGQTTGYSLSYTPNLNAIAIAATLYVIPYLAPVLAF